MGMTIAEKIIAAAAGVDSVKPGDIYTVSLDHRVQVNCNRVKTTKGNLKILDKTSKPLRVGVAVRQKGQDGCISSRIPGLATSNKGTLLAIFAK